MKYNIYTDGACSGNPGPGGYGIVIIDANGKCREYSKGFTKTTNNRMELGSVVAALLMCGPGSSCVVTTDSQYVANSINKKWLDGWVRNGWRSAAKKPVANQDLWQKYLEASKGKTVELKWIKGHAGHAYNERCDVLAVAAITAGALQKDEGFGDTGHGLF